MIKYKKTILSSLFAVALAGCGGGGETEAGGGTGSSQQQPAFSLLNIIMPSAIAAESPPGTVVNVLVAGNGVSLSKTIGADQNDVSFSDLVIGDYTLTVIVISGETELARDEQLLSLKEGSAKVTANLALSKASLKVEPIFNSDYAVLNGSYEGEFNKSGCLELPFNPASTDLILNVTGLAVELEFSFFPAPTIKLTGDLNDSIGELRGVGSYQSSDFTNGTWEINKVLRPSESTIFISGQLIDATNANCTIDFEYIGTDMGGIDMGL